MVDGEREFLDENHPVSVELRLCDVAQTTAVGILMVEADRGARTQAKGLRDRRLAHENAPATEAPDREGP